MATKPLLIFDFFGVVIGEVAHRWLRAHLDETHAQHIIDTILVIGDEGKLSEEELFLALEKETGIPASQIKVDWDVLGALNHETVNFIKKHKNDYHFALLSNAIRSYIYRFFERDHTEELFDDVFISSDIKLAKPNPVIFQYVLDHVSHPYSKAYMIDDSKQNLEGAKKVGIETIHFSSIKDVENALAKSC